MCSIEGGNASGESEEGAVHHQEDRAVIYMAFYSDSLCTASLEEHSIYTHTHTCMFPHTPPPLSFASFLLSTTGLRRSRLEKGWRAAGESEKQRGQGEGIKAAISNLAFNGGQRDRSAAETLESRLTFAWGVIWSTVKRSKATCY